MPNIINCLERIFDKNTQEVRGVKLLNVMMINQKKYFKIILILEKFCNKFNNHQH